MKLVGECYANIVIYNLSQLRITLDYIRLSTHVAQTQARKCPSVDAYMNKKNPVRSVPFRSVPAMAVLMKARLNR